MTSLAQFLADRLDEDEAVARAAAPGSWTVLTVTAYGRTDTCDLAVETGEQLTIGGPQEDGGDIFGALFPYDAEHVARHDPARVLAEVAAKRAILALHATYVEPANGITAGTLVGLAVLERTLRLLAQPYADHPAFRAEWAT